MGSDMAGFGPVTAAASPDYVCDNAGICSPVIPLVVTEPDRSRPAARHRLQGLG
jgi:hypothetical protein